jgi:Leucine-rich repeat (LRR) protein
LHELRVLNIAANQIKVVDNLNGLHSLVELNLRRNQIYEIVKTYRLSNYILIFNNLILKFNLRMNWSIAINYSVYF